MALALGVIDCSKVGCFGSSLRYKAEMEGRAQAAEENSLLLEISKKNRSLTQLQSPSKWIGLNRSQGSCRCWSGVPGADCGNAG